MEANAQGRVRLCLNNFVFAEWRHLPPQLATAVLGGTSLGRNLLDELSNLNVLDRIYGRLSKVNQSSYRRYLHVYLAGLVLCTTGAESLSEIGADIAKQWLSFYYNPLKKSFLRKDLFPIHTDVHKKIFKEIAKGFGAYFHNSTILDMGEMKRNPSDNRPSADALLNYPPPHLVKWVELWKKWRSTVRATAKNPKASFRYLAGYLDKYEKSCADPLIFLQGTRSISLLEDYKTQRNSNNRPELTGSDEFKVLCRFSDFLTDELGGTLVRHKHHPLVSEADKRTYDAHRKRLGLTDKTATVSSMPLPYHYYRLTREILLEGEHGWPGQHRFCRAWLRGANRYVPVLVILFLVLFDLPLRTIQVRRLCSGEGDERRFDGHNLKWIENPSSHAGYWKARGMPPYRGYARLSNDMLSVGFWINTNKHSPPFLVPWQNANIHRLLYDLLSWQENWNLPTRGPVQLVYEGDPEEGANDVLPIVFPLFRMPNNFLPVKYDYVNRFWLDLMLEVQTRWNAKALPQDQDYFVKMDARGRQVQSCLYSPHGMRSAGISLLLQNGLPLEFVGLLSGHATVIQAKKYDKSFSHFTATMNDVKADAEKRINFFAELKDMEVSQAKKRIYSSSDAALEAAFATKGTWQRRDLGICPYSGLRCGDGSPEGKLVEGGTGNCILCRHFLTGPEYIHGLNFEADYMLFLIGRLNTRIQELTDEGDELDLKIQSLEWNSKEHRELHDARARINTNCNDLTLQQIPYVKTFIEAWKTLKRCEFLESSQGHDTSSGPIVIASEHATFEWMEVSHVEHAAYLLKGAKVYKKIHDPEIEKIVQLFADEVLVRCGFEPLSMRTRTNKERTRDAELIVQRLIREISTADMIKAEKGELSIESLLPEGFSSTVFANELSLIPLNRPTVNIALDSRH